MTPDGATTLRRTIAAGAVLAAGSELPYRRLTYGHGERRILHPAGIPGGGRAARRRSLLVLVQLTDLQIADVASPGRFEFFERLRGQPHVGAFIPAQRPQEALTVHAVEAMARSIRSQVGSPDTGAPLDLALCTGDNVDNAQLNELTWYLSLLAGGPLQPASGTGRHEGVQSAAWPDERYWHPDGGPDLWHRRFGFPDYPGLLDEAAAPFGAGGVGVPWLSCFGNHDGLPFGEVVPTSAYRRLVLGGDKAVDLGAGDDPLGREEELFAHPEHFLTGPSRPVAADSARAIVSRRDFVAAHLQAPGLPAGHGFDERNLADGTAYATYDAVAGIRLVVLDSTNLHGRSDGSFGRRQMAWLEERLIEVHGRYVTADGRLATTGNDDRLVVLASHHGLAALTNDRRLPDGSEEDQPRATAAEFLAFLERFPNVVCWLNGHRHVNELRFRARGAPEGGGCFEISTASVADWPSQARLVELVANDDGTLSVLCTMLDQAAAPDPREEDGTARLASIHRELAANVPLLGPGSPSEGRPEDRNVELVMAAPFPLV